MLCPLCGTRKARRGCPALGQQICAVCCGTKRLVEISCPSDCVWLASAREHPPAAFVREQQRVVAVLVHSMRDFSERQSQLFLLINAFFNRYQPPELQPLTDDDVAEAAAALASTLETASRGVIYEHRPATASAARLATALKQLLDEAGVGGRSSVERDASVVLRRLREAVDGVRAQGPDNQRAYLSLIARVMRTPDEAPGGGGGVGETEVPGIPRELAGG